MSYCRFSDNSDVYLYALVDGDSLICHGCLLQSEFKHHRVGDATAALEHLQQHVAAGHRVPSHAVERLQFETTKLLTQPAAAARAFDALGDPTRLSIVERLRFGECSVGEIAEGMKVSRPAVSQHLQILKAASLVVDRPEGRRRFYMINMDGLDALREWLEALT